MDHFEGDPFLNAAICPIRFALSVVGGKWKLAIICSLAEYSPARFSEIRRKVAGITNVMLTQSLKELETHGVVHREQFNEVPPHVEYTLTQKGKNLMPVLHYLARWGMENMPGTEEGSPEEGQCRICKKE